MLDSDSYNAIKSPTTLASDEIMEGIEDAEVDESLTSDAGLQMKGVHFEGIFDLCGNCNDLLNFSEFKLQSQSIKKEVPENFYISSKCEKDSQVTWDMIFDAVMKHYKKSNSISILQKPSPLIEFLECKMK